MLTHPAHPVPESIQHELVSAYFNTKYSVPILELDIRIGVENIRLQEILIQYQVDDWVFITAWNPLSKPLPKEENKKRNIELREDLNVASWTCFDALGQGDGWPAEESFFVLGISLEDALRLGKKYEQNAIVVSTDEHIPCLAWCH